MRIFTLIVFTMFTMFIMAAFFAAPAAMAEPSAADGKKIFVKCGVCHSLEKDVSKVGPSLHSVIGRKAGTLPSFKLYSQAMKDSGVEWNEKTIAEFLRQPRSFIKGTRMIFIGLKDDKAISDLIAYLKSVK